MMKQKYDKNMENDYLNLFQTKCLLNYKSLKIGEWFLSNQDLYGRHDMQ